jgi:hypothetical protein
MCGNGWQHREASMDAGVSAGVVLRALREAHDLGLRAAARHFRCDPGHLSKMERGRRPLTRQVAALADDHLQTGGVLTSLLNAGYPGEQTDGYLSVIIVSVPGPRGGVTVAISRRALLAALAVGAVGGSGVLTRRVGQLSASPETVAQLGTALDGFVTAGRVTKPAMLVDPLIGRIGVINVLRREANDRTSGELAVLQSRYAEFLSWMCEEAGDIPNAVWWIDRASEWAGSADWSPMLAFARVRKSVISTMHFRDAGQTLHWAQAAMAAPAAPASVLRFAAAQVAYGHALRGDLAESRRALDVAAEHYDQAARQEEPSIGARSVLDVEANWATCNVYAGRGDDAVAVLAPRMRTISRASPRAFAIHGARLAHGYALAGSPAEACQTIGDVLDAVDLTRSATARAELRAAAVVLMNRWPHRTDVRDAVSRIRQAA